MEFISLSHKYAMLHKGYAAYLREWGNLSQKYANLMDQKNTITPKLFSSILLLIMLSVLFCYGLKVISDEKQLRESGVYVVGVKFKYKSGGNRMGSSYYYYYLNSKRYEYHVADGGHNKRILFLIILPSNPNICRIVHYVNVPSCITLRDVPQTGWKELPSCP